MSLTFKSSTTPLPFSLLSSSTLPLSVSLLSLTVPLPSLPFSFLFPFLSPLLPFFSFFLWNHFLRICERFVFSPALVPPLSSLPFLFRVLSPSFPALFFLFFLFLW